MLKHFMILHKVGLEIFNLLLAVNYEGTDRIPDYGLGD
jgi:hypothetical protein